MGPISNFEFSDIADDTCKDTVVNALVAFYVFFMVYILLPLFVISRLFSMWFPIISLIYFGFDSNSVQLLQLTLTMIYAVLVIVWIISAIECYKFYYWTTHLFPSFKNGNFSLKYVLQKQISQLMRMQQYYDERCDQVFLDVKRKQVVIEILGRDIGGLVISFWPHFDLKEAMQTWDQEWEHHYKTNKSISVQLSRFIRS